MSESNNKVSERNYLTSLRELGAHWVIPVLKIPLLQVTILGNFSKH
jgi:hypothetical protein